MHTEHASTHTEHACKVMPSCNRLRRLTGFRCVRSTGSRRVLAHERGERSERGRRTTQRWGERWRSGEAKRSARHGTPQKHLSNVLKGVCAQIFK